MTENIVKFGRIPGKKAKYATQRHFNKLGEYLRQKRVQKNLSQREVAEILNYCSAQFISNFECGIAAPPLKKMKVLIDLYDLNAELVMTYLLEEEKRSLSQTLLGKATKRSAKH